MSIKYWNNGGRRFPSLEIFQKKLWKHLLYICDTQELILSYGMYERTSLRTLLSCWTWLSGSPSNFNFSLEMSHWHRAEITEKKDERVLFLAISVLFLFTALSNYIMHFLSPKEIWLTVTLFLLWLAWETVKSNILTEIEQELHICSVTLSRCKILT